jgi:hypothetical protein
MADSTLAIECSKKVLMQIFHSLPKKSSLDYLWLLNCADNRNLAELSKEAVDEEKAKLERNSRNGITAMIVDLLVARLSEGVSLNSLALLTAKDVQCLVINNKLAPAIVQESGSRTVIIGYDHLKREIDRGTSLFYCYVFP